MIHHVVPTRFIVRYSACEQDTDDHAQGYIPWVSSCPTYSRMAFIPVGRKKNIIGIQENTKQFNVSQGY